MSIKYRVWVLVVIIALILILAIAFFFLNKVKTITAKEGYDYAESLAFDWSSDSKLFVIFSHEGAMTNIPDLSIDASNDPQIGDGKTVYWRYVFSSESKNKSYEISINSELEITKTEERDGSASLYSNIIGHDMTISNWIIDSDTAIKKALESDNELSAFINTYDNATIVIILRDLEFNITQSEFWEIEYSFKEGHGVKSVYVDASDGTVLHWTDLVQM